MHRYAWMKQRGIPALVGDVGLKHFSIHADHRVGAMDDLLGTSMRIRQRITCCQELTMRCRQSWRVSDST